MELARVDAGGSGVVSDQCCDERSGGLQLIRWNGTGLSPLLLLDEAMLLSSPRQFNNSSSTRQIEESLATTMMIHPSTRGHGQQKQRDWASAKRSQMAPSDTRHRTDTSRYSDWPGMADPGHPGRVCN